VAGATREGGIRERFELRVEESLGEAVVTARIPRSADDCYRLFTAFERMTEWLSVASEIEVLARDGQGRPTEVEFRGRLEHTTIPYLLHYQHDDRSRCVQWSSALDSSGILRIGGSVLFTPIDAGSAWMRYRLISQRAHFLPRWDDEHYQRRPAETVVLDFCEWVVGA
jgi:hypothetical protein